MYSYDSKYKLKKKKNYGLYSWKEIVSSTTFTYLEKNVDDKDIEDIFERIDDTVKHSLEFGNTFYSLEWSQNAQDSEGLDGA